MPERFDRNLQPSFTNTEGGKEGAAEKEYAISMSENDWQTINFLALDRIESNAAYAERQAKSHGLEKSVAEKQKEAMALNDMLTRWQESGAPVIAKAAKKSSRDINLTLPGSWAQGEWGVNDIKEYPEDGSLRILQNVRENTHNPDTKELQEYKTMARPDDWQITRQLIRETKATERQSLDDENKTIISLGSFGRSYANASVQNEMGIKPSNVMLRGQTIPEPLGKEITDREMMAIVNSRLGEIEQRLP